MTSTLARTADTVVDRLWPSATVKPPSTVNTLLLTLTWTGYLLGALIGALLVPRMAQPLLVPAALLLAVVLLGPLFGSPAPRPTSAA